MFRTILCSTLALVATSAIATSARAAENGQDDVKGAAAKLAAADNYSWKTTTQFGNNDRTTEGKTEKDGYTMLTVPGPNNSTREILIKGEKFAVKTDDGWKSEEELSQNDASGQPNRGRFMANMIKRMKAPGAEAEEIVTKVKELKQSGDAYEGQLSEEAAKELLSFGRRGGPRGGGANGAGGNAGGNANGGQQGAGGAGGPPQISNAKGTVKFWTKDGMISKYEIHLTGTRTGRDGNEQEVDRTSTTEISDVGSTKLEVPDEAKKKLS